MSHSDITILSQENEMVLHHLK